MPEEKEETLMCEHCGGDLKKYSGICIYCFQPNQEAIKRLQREETSKDDPTDWRLPSTRESLRLSS